MRFYSADSLSAAQVDPVFAEDIFGLGCVLIALCRRQELDIEEVRKGILPLLSAFYQKDLVSLVKSMVDSQQEKRPLAQQLLDSDFVKKFIASESHGKTTTEGLGKPYN